VPLPGVPFDEARATIANDAGRVTGEDDRRVPGVYCTGWIKRGPSGVIGTNKKDATETVEHLLADARAGLLPEAEDGDVESLLGPDVVPYAGWQAIDAAERAKGEAQGRPRVKLCRWDELLAAARR